MKQSFLDSLKSAPLDTAISMVKLAGYDVFLVPEECNVIPAVAIGNTVVLWQKGGVVSFAHAGDPFDME